MPERKFDEKFQIRTRGIREWSDPVGEFNRCESTPYTALEKLFKFYKLKKTDEVVDFGAGRGRVAFYIHNNFHIPVTGVEVNDLTYDEALSNKTRYRHNAKHIEAPIKFEYGLAQHYEIKITDNKFYFFNPFSVEIFKDVVNNILESAKKNNNRAVDIILYYPMTEYKEFLKTTPFELMNKIIVPGVKDKKEKFKIYRLSEERIESIRNS